MPAFLFARRVACLALVIAASACGDGPAGPGPDVDVTVRIKLPHTPAFGSDTSGHPTIACTVDVEATATGNTPAVWRDAMVRLYAGPNRTSPVDSLLLSETIVRESWGDSDIAPGEAQQGRWTLTASIPFELALEFRYSPGGNTQVKTTMVRFPCGPTIPLGTRAPAIGTLTIAPLSGDVEPGDTLVVDYAVTSDVGLWETAIEVTGPCEMEQSFAERLSTTATHSVRFQIPYGCRLGIPFQVSAYALNAAAQETSRSLVSPFTLVDRTPPGIRPRFLRPGAFLTTETFGGIFFAGDSITVYPNGFDNHSFRTLLWELEPFGVRDSLLFSGLTPPPFVRIPLHSDWRGPVSLRLYARDSSGNTSEAVITHPDSARILPTIARPTVSATLAGEIRDFAVDAPRGRIYVMQSNERRLTVLSAATLEIVRVETMPSIPSDLDLTPHGDSLILALPNQSALGVIDLRSSSMQPALLSLTPPTATELSRPEKVRVASNGKAFVTFAGSGVAPNTLVEVDLATGAQRVRTDAGDAGFHGGAAMERSPDGVAIVLNGGPTLFQRYDAGTDTFGPRRSAIPFNYLSAVSVGGRYTAIGLDVYDANLGLIRRVDSFHPTGTVSTAFTGDGESLLWLHWPIGIIRSRVSDGEIVERMLNPIRPERLRVSADGTILVTSKGSGSPSSEISRITLQ